jgi:alpha-tubulin suppressor-like RCC1 family protein
LACDSGPNIAGYPSAPGFSLSLAPSVVTIAPGNTRTVSIKAVRTGGLDAAISYAVIGAPPGLTVGVTPTSVADSSTLTIAASAALAEGDYSVVVQATTPGAAAQQATLAVTVSVPNGVSPSIRVVAAASHTCALSAAGIAYCWGYNPNGQLGNNDSAIVSPTPVAVAGGIVFQALAVSRVEDVTCALDVVGAAYCWGENGNGQLGDGTTTRRLTPTPVAGGLQFKSLAVGDGHACGVATNGTAYCWGRTANGAFGDGSVGTHLTPAVAAPELTFQSIVTGTDYTCGLTPNGAAYCWGLGFSGQLGDGSGVSSTTPVAVAGGLTFRSLAAGGLTACGLTTAGQAYCWGNNFYGTVGDGTSATETGTMRRASPVAVAGGLTFQSLSAGYQTMCGLTDSGAGYCWGYNFGAIGDGSFDHRSTPTRVAGGLTFKSISSGTGYGCGVVADDSVVCWGDNSDGGLGDGTIVSHATPEPVRWP